MVEDDNRKGKRGELVGDSAEDWWEEEKRGETVRLGRKREGKE
jgi:hypothetical protein